MLRSIADGTTLGPATPSPPDKDPFVCSTPARVLTLGMGGGGGGGVLRGETAAGHNEGNDRYSLLISVVSDIMRIELSSTSGREGSIIR